DLKKISIPGVKQVNFDTLLRQSDVISIHIHLNDETRGLFSRAAFRKMKPGVVIVNTSRGKIIDESALLEALESGRVAAAGIDVIENEWSKNIRNHPLVRYAREHDNLLITPHIGGATVESVVGARIFLAKRLAEYLKKNFR
ncbi:MAG: NAD(P)-dependent oxidoreductase, partial [Candidatus Omnitrophota bacterium]